MLVPELAAALRSESPFLYTNLIRVSGQHNYLVYRRVQAELPPSISLNVSMKKMKQ